MKQQESITSELDDKFRGFDELNIMMVNFIKVYDAENHRLENELTEMRLNMKIFSETAQNQNNHHTKHFKSYEITPNRANKRVLIVGDDNVKGIMTLLKNETDYKFDINCQRLSRPSIKTSLANP